MCPGTVEPKAPAAKPEPAPDKLTSRATVRPLSPARYKVEFTASEELRDKLERLQALIPGGDLASIIDAAVSEKLERLEAKRYGKTNRTARAPWFADQAMARQTARPSRSSHSWCLE